MLLYFSNMINTSAEVFSDFTFLNHTRHNASWGNLNPQDDDALYENELMESVDLYFLHILWTYIVPIIFVLIMVVGLFGNCCVVYVIVSKPSMRTTTNFMLLNLSVAGQSEY